MRAGTPVASPILHPLPAPPGIYRVARVLRRLSAILFVVILVFVGVVAYSAVQIVHAQPRLGNTTPTVEPNDTVGIATSFSVANPTYFTIQHLALHFLVLNASNVELVDSTSGPVSIPAGGVADLPIELYVPLTAAGTSLLTENQYLAWNVWGNASYADLFSVSVGEATQRAWGAPFDDLRITTGTPVSVDGVEEVPVTVSFANDADFAVAGAVDFQVVPPSGPNCAQGTFALNVPPGTSFNDTQNVGIAPGCVASGSQVDAQYVGNGVTVPLPPEAIS